MSPVTEAPVASKAAVTVRSSVPRTTVSSSEPPPATASSRP